MHTVLVTSVGRRVGLIRHFLDNGWRVVGVDASPDDCAAQSVLDPIYQVPRCDAPDYYDVLLELCSHENIEYVIPLYEPELEGFARLKNRFLSQGTKVIVSEPAVLEICLDKYRLYQTFRSMGIRTPDTWTDPTDVPDGSHFVIKPRRGMGGKDVYSVDRSEIDYYFNKVHDPIVQKRIEGLEYSIDAYVSEEGRVLSVVPRRRLEVRSGEVSKSITVEDEALTRQVVGLLSELKVFGPVTIQGIRETGTDSFYFIEVNPRFGGGVPLSIQAGIPYARFISGEAGSVEGKLHPYQSGLKMLRYDEAYFVSAHSSQEKGR